MKRLVLLCVWVLVTGTGVVAGAPQDPALKTGDLAPDFALPGSDGKVHRLADFKGVRPVVIAWFPKSFAKR